nr:MULTISPECIES: DUF6197 family protein [unclassified Streptomyces]
MVPTTTGSLLEWAAIHIMRVGIYQSRYSLFSGPGRLAHRRCSLGGALDVAAGRDRMAPDRTYDTGTIRAVYTEAYRLLAEHLDDTPVTEPTGHDALTRHKVTVHLWTLNPGRTAQEAAAALRSAAEIAHAADCLF